MEQSNFKKMQKLISNMINEELNDAEGENLLSKRSSP